MNNDDDVLKNAIIADTAITSATSGYLTINSSSVNSSSSVPNWYYTTTYSSVFDEKYGASKALAPFNYLNEEELMEVLDKIYSRSPEEAVKLFSYFLELRHFSEEHIMKFFPRLIMDLGTNETLSILQYHHKADIESGAYGELKLYFELNK